MNVSIEFSIVDPTHFFGYEKIGYKRQSIFIANKEKALLDALFLGHISPSEFKEILKRNKGKVNTRRLKTYARRISGLFLSRFERVVQE